MNYKDYKTPKEPVRSQNTQDTQAHRDAQMEEINELATAIPVQEPKLTKLPKHLEDDSFAEEVQRITATISDMLIEKNNSYGNSALDPIQVFADYDPVSQILVRIDDKLSRIKRGNEFPGDDTINDLIGYLILLKMAKIQ